MIECQMGHPNLLQSRCRIMSWVVRPVVFGFDDPASGQYLESLGGGAFDDLDDDGACATSGLLACWTPAPVIMTVERRSG